MATQVFIMPMIGTGTRVNPLRVKYSMTASSCIRDGIHPIALVATYSEYHETFDDFGDVFAFPVDLDRDPTGEFFEALDEFMDDRDFGVHAFGDEDSYRVVIRRLAGWFLIAQRMNANGGFNLESYLTTQRLDEIPLVESQAFIQSLRDLQLDVSAVQPSMSIAQAFYAICEQFDGRIVEGLESAVYGER